MSFDQSRHLILEEASLTLNHYAGWHIKRLIDLRENAVFEVKNAIGNRAVLRLHRKGYQTSVAIFSELALMKYLSEQGVTVPVPIPVNSGNLLVKSPQGRDASMLSWITGPSLAEWIEFHHSEAEMQTFIFRLGAELAHIHNITDKFVLPKNFYRPCWNTEGFFGRSPVWGRFWEHPALSDEKKRELINLREELKKRLLEFYSVADYGLIHADPLKENILIHRGHPVLIDYDDCGFGFRMYDLAVAMTAWIEDQRYSELSSQLHAGYISCRNLPENQWRYLLMFILIRILANLGWIIPRKEIEGSKDRVRKYIDLIDTLIMKWHQTP